MDAAPPCSAACRSSSQLERVAFDVATNVDASMKSGGGGGVDEDDGDELTSVVVVVFVVVGFVVTAVVVGGEVEHEELTRVNSPVARHLYVLAPAWLLLSGDEHGTLMVCSTAAVYCSSALRRSRHLGLLTRRRVARVVNGEDVDEEECCVIAASMNTSGIAELPG